MLIRYVLVISALAVLLGNVSRPFVGVPMDLGTLALAATDADEI